jgi:uncharacterized protein YdhG (YjbR/CyaY superfamily)
MTKKDKIENYILQFPAEVQVRLIKLRQTIKTAAPEAEELISYGMPAYKQNGILVWFAAHKNHIGFYPKAAAISVFKDELKAYKCTKGTIQFPHDLPLPYKLVGKLVRFRMKENAIKHKNTL